MFAAKQPNLTVVDTQRWEQNFSSHLGCDPALLREYFPRANEDQYMQVGLRQRPGTCVIGSEMVDPNWNRTTDFYNDFNRPYGFELTLIALLEKDAGLVAWFNLWRERQQPDFTPADRQAMAHLVPHLQRALFLNRRLAEADARDQAMEEALRRSPHGVVAVDDLGHIYYANPRAEAMLRAGDGLSAPQGVLCCAHPDDHERLRAGLRAAAFIGGGGGVGGPSPRLPSADLPAAGEIRSAGHARLGGGPGLPPRPHHPPPVPTVEAMRIAYGFTPAEARICELLLQDLGIREVAERLQITENTRKTHLRRIFAKCEVNSQAALIRCLLFGLGTKEVAAPTPPAARGEP